MTTKKTITIKDKKLSVGFSKKPKCCKHCKHRRFELVDVETHWSTKVTREENHRCDKHGFNVTQMASCDDFERI